MKRIIIIILSVLIILLYINPAWSANYDLTLQWDENKEPDLAVGENCRYKIYYKTGSSGQGLKSNYIGFPAEEPAMADEGVSTICVTVAMDENPDADIVQFTLHNVDDRYVYYIAVTALDNYGNESDLSNEINTADIVPIPYPAPLPVSLIYKGVN